MVALIGEMVTPSGSAWRRKHTEACCRLADPWYITSQVGSEHINGLSAVGMQETAKPVIREP